MTEHVHLALQYGHNDTITLVALLSAAFCTCADTKSLKKDIKNFNNFCNAKYSEIEQQKLDVITN